MLSLYESVYTESDIVGVLKVAIYRLLVVKNQTSAATVVSEF